jgi:hypothetical protein
MPTITKRVGNSYGLVVSSEGRFQPHRWRSGAVFPQIAGLWRKRLPPRRGLGAGGEAPPIAADFSRSGGLGMSLREIGKPGHHVSRVTRGANFSGKRYELLKCPRYCRDRALAGSTDPALGRPHL